VHPITRPLEQQETAALKQYGKGPSIYLEPEGGGCGGGTKRSREASGRMEKEWGGERRKI